LQDDLMKDPPDLTFLSQDFPLNDDSAFFDPSKDTELVDHMSQLVMEPTLGELPTLEETIALVQDCISNGSQSAASITSPDGSYMSSHTPPHVNCDPFSPTSSMGQPSPFLSPASSQISGPCMPSPSSVPTPDPSPLGRREGDPARVNISWQGVSKPNIPMQQQQHQQHVMSQQNSPSYGSRSSNYSMNPPNGNVISSKSAYLASVKKREREGYPSCIGNVTNSGPPAQGWPRMQQYNTNPPQGNMNSYNWNSGGGYRPLSHMQDDSFTGAIQNEDPTWGQGSQAVPPFEDTLPNLNYSGSNILSPPYQDDAMAGYGYQGNQVPVTTMPSTKLGGW